MKLDLTHRQRQIVHMLISGRTIAQVAAKLAISLHTVNSTIRRARLRNGVESTNALMAAAAGRTK